MEENLYELELLFRSIYRKLRDEFNNLNNEFVTPNEYIVMKFLLKGGMRLTDISKALQVSASHITSVTDSLVEKDLISRQRSVKDRRVIDLSLTTKGTELINRLSIINSRFMHEKFIVFSESERTVLIDLLRKLETQFS